ncbi:uncharacterized protein LOC107770282 [Nicotiana tabacum]|uniref:uncharacterized protein LOC107770282 n=1 Tax=Nicotiana tabacum TaxID=4097 RepID=UPI003F4E4BF9
MMGLGSLGNGGSSSSFSNLSPLAPPFTVDRSNSKPTSNPLLNSSFGQSWQYAAADPSPSGYIFFSKHEIVTDSVPTTCLPEFSPSDSVIKPHNSNNLWSTSNPTANTSTDPYSSFGCEGYYAPYVPNSVVSNDTPSASFNETSFDVLPNSGGNIPVNVSSQVDYSQSLSGLEYPVPHWNSVWSQMTDGKQDERKVNASASFGYRNCISQGNSFEGVNIAGEDTRALSGNFTDGMYIGPSSMGHMDDKSYLAQEPVYPSFNPKTACTSSIPSASCQAGLSLGSSNNYLNYENPFTPHEKFFQPLDSCLRDTTSTSKSSPVVVIRPAPSAPSGSRFLAQKTDLNRTVDICKTGASKSEKSDVYDLLKGEETRLPIGFPVKGFSLETSLLNFGKDLKDNIVFASSSISNQHPCGSNTVEITVKERSGFQAPYGSAPPVTFSEKCSDALDLHNSNEDSPCWKGAPAFRISLCDSVEAPSPCHFKSKLECSDFGQSNPLFPPAEHSGRTDDLHKHNVCAAGIGLSVPSQGTGTNNYITEEHRNNDVTKETFEHMNLSSGSRVLKFSEDLNKPSKGYDLPQYSENDSQLQPHLTVDEHKYEPTNHSLIEGFIYSGLNLNDSLEGGVVALDAAENVLRSPASQEDAKQAQPYQIGSSPKLDVQTLVRAIHNLSELLKTQCLTNECLLEEQDHDALKHAITNLGACTSKKIETKETMFSQHDTFEKSGESCRSYMGTGTGHPQFMEEVAWDACGLGYPPMHEDKSKNDGKKVGSSSLLTPSADELRDSKEEQVAQAIKKVLNENFLCDEAMPPLALLFKNLWLEAEAKLCSLSYKARFDRMKIEMEKHKVTQGKNLNLNSSVAPEAENDLASKTSTQSPSTSSKRVHIDDSEDSVMERFNILNRREEKLSSSFMKEENDSAVVAGDAGDSVTMRLNILRQQGNNISSSFLEENKDQDVVANDAEDSVMGRLNILRQRGDGLKSSFVEEKKDQDVVANDAEDSVLARLNILRQRGDNLNSSFMEEKKYPDIVANDAEDSVLARLNILRQRGDNLNSSFLEEKKYPDLVANDAEDSVMARFNVLTHRGDNLNLPYMEVKKDSDMVAAGMEKLGLSKGEVSEDQRANLVIEPYFYHHNVNVSEGKFGSYVDDSGYDSMKQFLLSVADDPVVHSNWKARPGNQNSSGLYDNSSSDWEHVAKDEFV